MPIPLLEGVRGAVPFIVDRSQPFLTEQRGGKSFVRIPGRFSLCDSVNGNNRRYPKKVWEKNLAEGSRLMQSIGKNSAFGLLEHPANGQISLQSPICIAVTEAKLQTGTDAKGNLVQEVVGAITVLNTAEGQKLNTLIEFGYNPLVSSRGFGSVVKASDGVDDVQEDYICEGWDTVLQPSFETAELWPDQAKEAKQVPAVKQETALAENKDSTAAKPAETDLKAASSPSKTESAVPAPAVPVASAHQQMTERVMTIQEIKSRISALGGNKVPIDPARFAEGMNEMAGLHQDIANFVAEDAKRSWQGTQLHDEVKAVERTWSESALAPTRTATRLTESYRKVLKVTKAVGEAAVGLKKKLSEAMSNNVEATKLVEDLTERGQAWVAHAGKLKEKNAELNHRLDVACEALDIITDRYNEDLTELGKRLITLEFAEKAQTEEIQKALKEASLPKHIVSIREKLDPKKPEGKTEAKTEAKTEGKTEAKPAAQQESKKDSEPVKAPEGSTPMVEARVLVPSVRTITESVDMVKRLSASAK